MAKRSALLPAWTSDLDALIAVGATVSVWCAACHEMAPVDLIQLRLRVGGKYSLVNRRCRCRLTANCPGWNRFYYLQGCNRHLADAATLARWERSGWGAILSQFPPRSGSAPGTMKVRKKP